MEGLTALRNAATSGEMFDLVILDHHMPGMTGADVAMLMRADADLVDMPVVMLTSVDETNDGASFMSLNIQAHLVKPARSSLLFNTIVNVLQQNDAALESVKPSAAPAAEKPEPAIEKIEEAPVEEPAAAPIAPKEPSPAAPAEAAGKTIDVLIAEDNEVNRLVFMQILESLPYGFKIANNGREAVELYKELNPRILLMDVSMPEMNSFEATQAIRDMEKDLAAHTPIIGVTAHAIKDDRERCLNAGMDDYVSKPISPKRLSERIDYWIKEVQARVA